jgi:DNA-binding MarR family transcriptional regulator
MPRATLTLSLPDVIWIGDLSRQNPELRLRVLAAVQNGDYGVALVELSASDPDAAIAEMRSYESIAEVHRLSEGGEKTLVQLETTVPLLLEPIQRSGVPLEMPFTIQNGTVVWEVTTSRDRLSKLGEHLDDLGIPFTVESIYQEIESERLLTDNQWTILSTAAERGYYDTPRRCTQEELADALGIAKSTCSETLHRAEERVIKRFIEGREDPDDDTERPKKAV